MKRSRGWSIVINNYTDQCVAHVKDMFETKLGIDYGCFGLEVGEKGTPHIQGYLYVKNKISFKKLKATFPTAHLEPTRGTSLQNRQYCAKTRDIDEVPNEIFWETGHLPQHQGKRTDWEEILEMIQNQETDQSILKRFPGHFIRNQQGIRSARRIMMRNQIPPKYSLSSFPEQWRTLSEFDWKKSLILWGPSGVGKTCFARALLPKALWVRHKDTLVDYNPVDYDGIIFDDMNFNHERSNREAQIHLVDIDDDSQIHVRYSVALIPAGTKKIFTTNVHNGLIFDLSDDAIRRRCSVHHLDKFQ
jgi:hypothetical protein